MLGELFFGTDRAFKNEFALRVDPNDIVLNIDNCRVCDYSGLAAMNSLCDRYLALGKTLQYQTPTRKTRSSWKNSEENSSQPFSIPTKESSRR